MKTKQRIMTVVAAGILLVLLGSLTLAQEAPPQEAPLFEALSLEAGIQAQAYNGFTYQGRLLDDGSPAGGEYDVEYRLYAVSGGGTPLATISDDLIPGSDGLFTVKLRFGSQYFTGEARWLEIALRPSGSADPYTALAPRQELTPAPYALHALDAWSLNGNAGTDPGANFLGTTDEVALTLAVSSTAALRLEWAYDWGAYSPNLIGGCDANSVAAGAAGATIGGGGVYYQPNAVYDSWGTVGGGLYNRVGSDDGATDNAGWATVAGGNGNQATEEYAAVGGGSGNEANGEAATVAGGFGNQANGTWSTVAGGAQNRAYIDSSTVCGGYHNVADGNVSFVGGGAENYASPASVVCGGVENEAHGQGGAIAGGFLNTIGDGAFNSTIGGGHGNSVAVMVVNGTIAGGGRSDPGDDTTGNRVTDAYGTVGGGGDNQAGDATPDDAVYATVGGGLSNRATASYATVPGGHDNVAGGQYSFAAGQRAQAVYDGSFVWNDSTAADLASDTPDQWMTRASGGYYLWTSLTAGVYVNAGGGSWSSLSDRDLKENVEAVDPRAVLEAVAAMPVSTWNYTTEDAAVRHMGPMAQDFHAAFALGDSERHINSLDADGVALAAIQGLYLENQALQAQVEALEARLDALEKTSGAPAAARPAGGWLLAGLAVVAGGVLVQRRAGGKP
ncbi:MAG: tail fiber domain-containing protein [Anaerolineae bacterium]|nr:tail fiber domain-containing protein [Anaerolineae bacterium]